MVARTTKTLRGYLVGEARLILESQERIEQRTKLVLIVSTVSAVLILIAIGFLLGATYSVRPQMKRATVSLQNSSAAVDKAARELSDRLEAGFRGNITAMSGLRDRLESIEARLKRWETQGLVREGSAAESGQVPILQASQEPAKKRPGCLSLF